MLDSRLSLALGCQARLGTLGCRSGCPRRFGRRSRRLHAKYRRTDGELGLLRQTRGLCYRLAVDLGRRNTGTRDQGQALGIQLEFGVDLGDIRGLQGQGAGLATADG